jgi:magnesium chelatase family protein
LRAPGAEAVTGIHGTGAPQHDQGYDLADVVGQISARTAVEVAAVGGHHLFLEGPPGAGKTMLAERLPAVLPRLGRQESLEVTAVHSVAGLLPPGKPLIDIAPYCAPHHSATMQALVGGGPGIARPGAVSLSHRGVLFLDETPEFSSRALDALRQPLESGHVVIARSAGVVRFPARFLMVLAANPCPCGRFSQRDSLCECPPSAIRRYQARLSGPLLDRVDLRVEVDPVTRAELTGGGARGETTARVADRVREARERTAARLAGTPWRTNSEVPGGSCAAAGTPRAARWTRPSAAWRGASSRPGGSTVCCGSPGPSRTSWATTGRVLRTWHWPCSCAPGSPTECPWPSGR